MHGEIGVNVLQENDDDVDMPDVAIHDADEDLYEAVVHLDATIDPRAKTT